MIDSRSRRAMAPSQANPDSLSVRRYRAGDKPHFGGEVRDLRAHLHLLGSLVHRDLTVRYKRSVIGFFWTMLNPLLLMLIFVAIFSAIFRFSIEHYETYFLSEYLPWNFFSQATVGSMASIAWNGALMKRVRVPGTIFALSTTISGLVNLVLSMIPLFAIMLLVGAPLRPALAFLPVSFALLAIFTLGLSLALSSVAVVFADVREMWTVAVTGLMYLTPIIYPISIVPERYRWLIEANPLTYLLETIRAPIYEGRIPDSRTLVISAASALVALMAGWLVFRRLSPRFFVHV